MDTDPSEITDTERLDAMFRYGWRTYKHKGKTRISGIKESFPTPREAVDNAIQIERARRGNKRLELSVSKSAIPSGFTWKRWELHVFPADTPRHDLVSSAHSQGWKLSIVVHRKSKKLCVMAMDTLKPSS